MAWFLVRVELVDVESDHAVYTSLHTAMKSSGFDREYTAGEVIYELPRADYIVYDDAATAAVIRDRAKGISERVHAQGSRIVVLQGSQQGFAMHNLKSRQLKRAGNTG